MSKVTDIYDAITNEMATLFPTKKLLFNPYRIEDNPNFVLIDGYGVAVGPSESPDLQFNTVSQSRAFDISITKQVVKTNDNTVATDTQVKALLEELNSTLLRFCNADQLSVELSIDAMEIGGCSGIEFIQGESERFIFILQTINIIW